MFRWVAESATFILILCILLQKENLQIGPNLMNNVAVLSSVPFSEGRRRLRCSRLFKYRVLRLPEGEDVHSAGGGFF